MSWPSFPWFKQCFIEGLLIGYKPPLIVYFFLVLDKPFSPNLSLLFFDLFSNEILQPQIGPLSKQVLYVLKLLLALSKRALDHLRIAVGL